jgi:hypothetical protein
MGLLDKFTSVLKGQQKGQQNVDVGFGSSKCPKCGLSKSPSVACYKCFPNVIAKPNTKIEEDYKKTSYRYANDDILSLKKQLISPDWETLKNTAEQFGDLAKTNPDKVYPIIPALIYDFRSNESRVASGAALAFSKIAESNPKLLEKDINDLLFFLDYAQTRHNHDVEIIAIRATVCALSIVITHRIVDSRKCNTIAKIYLSQYLNDDDVYLRQNAKEGYDYYSKWG